MYHIISKGHHFAYSYQNTFFTFSFNILKIGTYILLEYILAMFWRFDCTKVFRDGRKQNDMAKVALKKKDYVLYCVLCLGKGGIKSCIGHIKL